MTAHSQFGADARQLRSLLANIDRHDFLIQGMAVDVSRGEADGQRYVEPRVDALDLELAHETAHLSCDGGQFLSRFLRLLGTRRRPFGSLRHSRDVGRDVAGSASRFAGVSSHFIGGCALLFDCGRDSCGNVVGSMNFRESRGRISCIRDESSLMIVGAFEHGVTTRPGSRLHPRDIHRRNRTAYATRLAASAGHLSASKP